MCIFLNAFMHACMVRLHLWKEYTNFSKLYFTNFGTVNIIYYSFLTFNTVYTVYIERDRLTCKHIRILPSLINVINC